MPRDGYWLPVGGTINVAASLFSDGVPPASVLRSASGRAAGSFSSRLKTISSISSGRSGAVLVRPDGAECIPIVRTTTRYNAPAQCFRPVHERPAQRIQDIASLPVGFNNALIENYSNPYTTMGGHSDSDDIPLTLASEDQKREFFHLRRRENQETDFTYLRLTYTISESDLMPPGR